MKTIENQSFDQERALYGAQDVEVRDCQFAGPADGESVFKECRNVIANHCYFDLRYPFWHDHTLSIYNSEMTENCRASLWYSDHVLIEDSKLNGIKAVRECGDVTVRNCQINSPEFGWSTRGMRMEDSKAISEYFMLRSFDLTFRNVDFTGKYSFQYLKNGLFENCVFDTKDAFWHSENVTVKDSTIKGEYLAWYSDGLTLIRCKIIGTQPLCYCKNLKLIDCEMINTDLAFEKSDVEAVVNSSIVSVKNPHSGIVAAKEVGELIMDDLEAKGTVIIGSVRDVDQQ